MNTAVVAVLLFLTLAAESVPDNPFIGPGWVGAGLLGAVLMWLLRVHLPAKDQQVKELVTSRDVLVRELTLRFDDILAKTSAAYNAEGKARRDDFKDTLASIVSHSQQNNALIGAALERQLKEHAALIVDLRKSLEDLREAYGHDHNDAGDSESS